MWDEVDALAGDGVQIAIVHAEAVASVFLVDYHEWKPPLAVALFDYARS